MSTDVDDFKYSEALLAEQLGLSRADVKFARDRELIVEVDWKKNSVGFVTLTADGVAKILCALGNDIAVDLECCLATAVQSDASQTPLQLFPEKNGAVHMIVSKIPLNPRVVLATNAERETCTVDVGNNAHFVVGDQIDTLPHSAQPGFWRFVGQMPRSRRRINGQPI